MIKWSRVHLAVSIVSAAGLWQTLAERIGFARSAPRARDAGACGGAATEGLDVSGALHVHSTYSDGNGTIEEIAAAGARAGVDFVLVCDHSNLSAAENGQQRWYEDGKTLIAVGTEVSTDAGHLVLLDVPPGFDIEPGGSVPMMRSLAQRGGYGFIALPCDLKDHWRDFSKRQDGFGLEVFNLSSISRDKINLPGFVLAGLRYLGKKPLSAYSYVASRPNRELRLWDRLCREAFRARRPVPSAFGCLDAHGQLKFNGKAYAIPPYEETFRTCRTHVLVEQPLARRADSSQRDLALINAALRSGRSYISYDNYGDPRGFSFVLRGGARAGIGETVTLPPDPPRRKQPGGVAEVRSPSRRSIIRLLRDGRTVARTRGARLSCPISQPGVYRVEVVNYRWRIGRLCFGTRPWIFSNPIVVRAATA